MLKVNVISGFLGAGKTTLIKKLLEGSIKNEKIVLLENEYGDVSVDGSFMKDAGITVTEMSNGCICCSLVGDLQDAIDQLIADYQPDRLLVEPSGVGKLSEIVAAVEKAKARHDMEISGCATVVDAKKCKMHMNAFGEFYLDQIKTADTIIFSRTQLMTADKVEAARALVEENHPGVRIVTTPWDDLSADAMMEVIESGKPILKEEDLHHDHDEHCTCGCHDHEHHHHDHDEHCECGCHDHEHHHHDHDEHCECGCHDHEHHHHDHDEHCECGCHDHEHHHHDHDEHCECGCHDHEHHHHDHDEHCECGCHDHEHHHHDHDEHCECGCHDHEHHHHDHDEHCECGCHDHEHHHGHHHHHGHDADEVFVSVGAETARRYEQDEIAAMLEQLEDHGTYGHVLRAKGVLQDKDGNWFQFDYVPGESQFRPGTADYTGRLCVIGAHIREKAVRELFHV